jgi:hypothetical protein
LNRKHFGCFTVRPVTAFFMGFHFAFP